MATTEEPMQLKPATASAEAGWQEHLWVAVHDHSPEVGVAGHAGNGQLVPHAVADVRVKPLAAHIVVVPAAPDLLSEQAMQAMLLRTTMNM